MAINSYKYFRKVFYCIIVSGICEPVIADNISPVTFLENKGQWSDNILYQSVSTSVNVYFMSNGLSFGQSIETENEETGEEVYEYLVWNMIFENPKPGVIVSGTGGSESKVSYLYGNDPGKWIIHPAEFTSLKYENLYDNIDMMCYGEGDNLKYDYIIHPGGSIASIASSYRGTQGLSINDNNELEVATKWNIQKHKEPKAWQEVNGIQQTVDVKYVLINDTTFGFAINGSYNPAYELIIDPLFELVWSSFTKATGVSNNINYCFSNAFDASGNVYLTGMVDGTYPTTPGAYSGPGTVVPEIFVSKFSKDGSTLLYSTYISGSSDEKAMGIAVDALGQAYIVGHAMANFTGGNTYPTTSSAYQPVMYSHGGYDAVLTVLNANGTGLIYSTYLGGNNDDEAYAIALGAPGSAYITGYTYSGGTTFPVKGTSMGAQQSAQGYRDVFVAKFDINQSGVNSLVYSIHLGGGGDDYGRAIAVNSAGNAFITGRFQAISPPNFPTTSGVYNTTYSGGWDNMMVFATMLSATTPVTYMFSTYLAPGMGSGIAINSSTNEAYIVGSTSTFGFPTTAGVIQPVHGQDALGNPNSDAFVLKLNSSGSGLLYSTFLGGARADGGTGISLNSAGEVYIVGTASTLFPTSTGSIQPNHSTGGGDTDFFVAHLNSTASAYACGGSTYFGGNDMDYGTPMYDYPSPKVSLRNYGGITDTICVSGTSHSTNFPTTAGSYGPNKLNGIADQPVFFKLTCFVDFLPVELKSFTGENEGSRNLLEWETASEQNSNFFALEKSKNARDFETLAIVEAAGYSTTVQRYSQTDETPFAGITYYRLILMDRDGRSSYSSVIAVISDEDSEIVLYVYPNPAQTFFTIELPHNTFDLEITHTTGRIVFEEKNIQSKIQVNCAGFPRGMYIVKAVSMENKTYTEKLIKY